MSIYTQESLDSLRNARNKLYEIDSYTLASWSLEDQEKYADDMHRFVLQIMAIEKYRMSQNNTDLTNYEKQLQKATSHLEKICLEESNLLLMIRGINSGLGAVDEIIELMRP